MSLKSTTLKSVTVFVLTAISVFSQSKSAIQFYDTTGATKTGKVGWTGDATTGYFFLQTPQDGNALITQPGVGVTIKGTMAATKFSGDGSALTNLPATGGTGITGLQDSLKKKADVTTVTALQSQVNAKADSASVNTKLSAKANSSDLTTLQTQVGKKADTTWVSSKIGAAGGGTITGVTADSGLSGGGTTGSVSLKLKYGGTGSSSSVARSDHSHTGLTDANITSLSYSKLTGTPTIPTVPASLPPNGTASGDLAGSYPSPTIKAGTITDASVNASAAISGSKINPAFGNQAITTSGKLTLNNASTPNKQFGFINYKYSTTDFFQITRLNNGTYVDAPFSIYWDNNLTAIAGKLNIDTLVQLSSGTAVASCNLQVNGSLSATSCCQSSDVRFKKDITPINNALDNVLKLQGVNFNWRKEEFPKKNFSDKPQIGFIAQDVEKIVPSVVSTDNDGYKAVSYDKLTAVLVEAIKEQQKIIEIQNKRISQLEAKLNK